MSVTPWFGRAGCVAALIGAAWIVPAAEAQQGPTVIGGGARPSVEVNLDAIETGPAPSRDAAERTADKPIVLKRPRGVGVPIGESGIVLKPPSQKPAKRATKKPSAAAPPKAAATAPAAPPTAAAKPSAAATAKPAEAPPTAPAAAAEPPRPEPPTPPKPPAPAPAAAPAAPPAPPPPPPPAPPSTATTPSAPNPPPQSSAKPQPAPAPVVAPAAKAEPPRVAAVPPAVPTKAVAPEGELSLRFDGGSSSLGEEAQRQLDGLAATLAKTEDRIQLKAYATATGADAASGARRLSLSRALAVRSYLIEKGVRSTRIDVRALGPAGDSGPPERVDIVKLDR